MCTEVNTFLSIFETLTLSFIKEVIHGKWPCIRENIVKDIQPHSITEYPGFRALVNKLHL